MTTAALAESLDFALSSRVGFGLPSGAFLPAGGEFSIDSETHSPVCSGRTHRRLSVGVWNRAEGTRRGNVGLR